MTRKVTTAIVLTYTITLILWDIYVASNSILGDTESEFIRDMAFRYPSIAVAWNTLSPHFFIPRPHSKETHWRNAKILAAVGAALIILDILGWLPVMSLAQLVGLPGYLGLVPYVALGFGLGFLWSQQPPKVALVS